LGAREVGVLSLLGLFAVAPGLSAGCVEEPGATCVGGVEVGGVCQPKCDPAKCIDGNVCVNNQCELVCVSQKDCNWPAQECRPTSDTDAVAGDVLQSWLAGASGVCTDVGRWPLPGVGTFGVPCPNGFECNAFGCPNGLECDPNACHDGVAPRPELCVRDEVGCGSNETCNMGWCSNTNAPCILTTCAANECTPFACRTTGEGDMNAYCTHHDCTDDSDCPAGFACGETRDPHDICGATCSGGYCSDDDRVCTGDSDCQKGNNTFCGETDEACIDPANFSANGATYFEGATCLLRKTCVKRTSCMPCQHNRDCSLDADQVCIPLGGETVCARFCLQDTDCFVDELCGPSYDTCESDKNLPCPSAGCPPRPCVNGVCAVGLDGLPGAACARDADCPLQACAPRKVCVPRTGTCRAPDGGFCQHCVDDADCGGAGSTQACRDLSAGERACFDMGYPDECPNGTNAECPLAPSGRRGRCRSAANGFSATSGAYLRCDFPFDTAVGRSSCWP
jgi:hypothetical protein